MGKYVEGSLIKALHLNFPEGFEKNYRLFARIVGAESRSRNLLNTSLKVTCLVHVY